MPCALEGALSECPNDIERRRYFHVQRDRFPSYCDEPDEPWNRVVMDSLYGSKCSESVAE